MNDDRVISQTEIGKVNRWALNWSYINNMLNGASEGFRCDT